MCCVFKSAARLGAFLLITQLEFKRNFPSEAPDFDVYSRKRSLAELQCRVQIALKPHRMGKALGSNGGFKWGHGVLPSGRPSVAACLVRLSLIASSKRSQIIQLGFTGAFVVDTSSGIGSELILRSIGPN